MGFSPGSWKPGRPRPEPTTAWHFRKGVTEPRRDAPAQVALACVHGQGERLGVPVVPIPGTKRIKWLEQNVAALDVTLTPGELAVLDPLGGQVVGARY